MLKVSEICTFYGASQALFGVSITVEEGEVVSLLGKNGMGKTTTVHSIMGITPISSGEVLFQNKRIDDMPSFKVSRSGIGLVPEGRQIFPNLSVIENLIATSANRSANPNPWTIESVLQMFPQLKSRLNSMGNLLSGGEQQMLAIGRALMTNPKLLILDEATEGLAPMVRQEIWACIERLKKEGIAILIIDKNIRDLTRISDKHFIIEKGQVTWNGSSDQLLLQQDMLEEKLGV
ncbi:MAG: ABC transporter ATP-binding protein [Thalassobaculaceae bacterium]|jgi:branched-chain amino acid transport system ATP-binding protein|nr:ABC transporter ATP-binding protein [Rhodospirillaceae bacterium]OUU55754.1 MAG: ABC transporter ATP-binding protein [Candidatus Endolissoclinum sp. TMED55]|tara:strand:- start:1114 stop:1815 length:702 start_codon:yes stop_codon:yes gene_type:complete